MRFLFIDESGKLVLSKYFTEHVPPYAILSHLWGEDEDEVNYQDFDKPMLPQKPGLAKLKLCVEQAKKDGIQYSWIDTCCINRFNHAELSEAITSMFRWYKNSTKCYVYMSDVALPNISEDQSDVNAVRFRGSRYWKRGWTLQELLAPADIEFFSAEWHSLGSKQTVEQEIQRATEIPIPALRGTALSEFLTEERLQWASNRVTKRAEDKAYCLLGIFNISMSLRYGEGSHAFERLLKKINKLPEAKHEVMGGLDSKTQDKILSSLLFPEIDARRQQIQPPHEGTFEWVLEDNPSQTKAYSTFVNWLHDQSSSSKVFTVVGKPGAGKSSLMAFLAAQLDSRPDSLALHKLLPGYLASFFFWQPGHNELQKSLAGMLRTLLYNLFEQNPDCIHEAVSPRRWRSTSASFSSILVWTIAELQDTLQRCLKLFARYKSVMLLIDGLDECVDDKGDCSRLLSAIQGLSAIPNVRLCVSCRPMLVFTQLLQDSQVLRLHELNYDDIATYVEGSLLEDDFVELLNSSESVKVVEMGRQLVERSEGVFLWAVLVVRDLCRAARNGSDLDDLEALLSSIPDDLAEYFQRMLSAIEPEHRYEASTIFQIALWEEPDFTTLQRLHLLDLAYSINITNRARDFSTQNDLIDLRNIEDVYKKLESTSRRLQSRCKGMLRCYYDPKFPWPTSGNIFSESRISGVEYAKDIQSLSGRYKRLLFPLEEDPTPFGYRVEFLHRSLRDYLLSPEISRWLISHTDGPIDARRVLCEARLSQAEAAVKAHYDPRMAMFEAGHIIAVLATPGMRRDVDALPVFWRLWPVIQYTFVYTRRWEDLSHLYIAASLRTWHQEESTPLSLAIDFGIDVVVQHCLKAAQIKEKTGRPLLDYALRPRFVDSRGLQICLRIPNLSYVNQMIQLGADLNEMYEKTTIFSSYLCFMKDYFRSSMFAPTAEDFDQCFSVTEALVRQQMLGGPGAEYLRRSWLCQRGSFSTYYGIFPYDLESLDEIKIFHRRWYDYKPSTTPQTIESQGLCELSRLLDCFRPWFGSRVDHLQSLANP